MAATIVRTRAIDTQGGDLELFAFQLFDAAGRVDAAAVLTSSHSPIAGTLTALQDSDSGTSCRFARADVRAPGFYLQWEFSAPVSIRSIRLGANDRSECIRRVTITEVATQEKPIANLADVGYPGDGLLSGPIRQGSEGFAAVSLLMRPVASDISLIEDSSSQALPMTVYGGAKGSNAVQVFGSPTVYFNGTDARVRASGFQNPNINGAFTYEFYLQAETVPSAETIVFSSDAIGSLAVLIRGQRLIVVARGVGQIYDASVAPTLQAGILYYLKIMRTSDGLITCSLNGTVYAAYSGGIDFFFSGSSGIDIGYVPPWTPGYYFHGYMLARCTSGVARLDMPTDGFLGGMPEGLVAPQLTTQFLAALVAASGEVPPAQGVLGMSSLRVNSAHDFEFGGSGGIYGTVARKGTPSNVPLKRRVRLHRSKDGYLVRETWSKTDGSYAFTEISTRYEYDVIAWDHLMQEFSTVANNQLAEVMP